MMVRLLMLNWKKLNNELVRVLLFLTLEEPTEEEVNELKSKPCDHTRQPMLLVTDIIGFMYDFRSCVICGGGLGAI